MGALISLIKQSNANEETPFASLALVDLNIQVDPSPQEASLVLQSNLLLSQSDTLLPLFQEYQGCGLLIRAAISSPSKLTEDAAWEKVLPAVAKLRDYYEFALKLDQVASSIIQFLCSNSSLLANLDANTTSAKKLADLLLIVAKYDECKMSNPNIQNDFSYYRRTLSKMRMSNPSPQALVVNDELANRMSLFYAHSTPLSKLLIDSSIALSGTSVDAISELYAALAAVCYYTLLRPNQENQDYFLRVMVLCIVLYDHTNPSGAFSKTASINVKASVKVIRESGSSLAENLVNILKYSTLHLNDEATPKATKALFL